MYYFPVLLYAFAYGQFCAERHSFISVHIVFHEGLNEESGFSVLILFHKERWDFPRSYDAC